MAAGLAGLWGGSSANIPVSKAEIELEAVGLRLVLIHYGGLGGGVAIAAIASPKDLRMARRLDSSDQSRWIQVKQGRTRLEKLWMDSGRVWCQVS